MNKTVSIVGMHRSGTSMLAHWLSQAGLFVGSELLGARQSNELGHFEDKDFLNLQDSILRSNGLDYLVQPRDILTVNDYQRQQAVELIYQRTELLQWGWKDPRTSLFLPMWKSIIPTMKSIIIYRPITSVVTSLLKRDQKNTNLRQKVNVLLRPFRFSTYNIWRIKKYIGAWLRYNQGLLDYVGHHSDDCLVINVDMLQQQSNQLLKYMNEVWGFELGCISFSSIFNQNLFHSTSPLPVQLACRYLTPDGEDTWDKLEAQAKISLDKINLLER